LLALACVLSPPCVAFAGETTLAEPVVEENITDVDAVETGTLEFDATGAALGARSRNAGTWRGGVEAEWRAVDRLGIGVEMSVAGPLDRRGLHAPSTYEPRGAVSYVFARDDERRMYLQAEAAARWQAGGAPPEIDPTEPDQPYVAGVRAATVLGPMTLRAALLGEAGSDHAHARASWAALFGFVGSWGRLYLGAELLGDWARPSPFLVVPEVLVLAPVASRPIRLGIGAPLSLGPLRDNPVAGIAVRLVLEPNE
jgi:hypothetical protein